MYSYRFLIVLVTSSAGLVRCQADNVSMAFGVLNGARQYSSLEPLIWNNTLAVYAEFWAEQMASGQQPFGHAWGVLRPNQGENIYESASTDCDAICQNPLQAAVHNWLAEGSLYNGQPVETGDEPWLHWCESVQ